MPDITDSPFYRVTARAIIKVEDKLLVVKDHNGDWQLPGGGWEHDEPFETAVEREVLEEVSAKVTGVGNVLFMYRQLDQRGYVSLRLAVAVDVEGTEFKADDGMTGVGLVTRQEFLDLIFCKGEGPIQDHVDQIWPTVDN